MNWTTRLFPGSMSDMSWHGISPDVGLRVQEFDAQAGVLFGELPILPAEYEADRLTAFVRKTLVMMGLRMDANPQAIHDDRFPVAIKAESEVGDSLLQDIPRGKLKLLDDQQLSADGERPLAVGCVVNTDHFLPVAEAELRQAEAIGDIAFGGEHEFYPGGVRVRLADVVTVMPDSHLKKPDASPQRRAIAMHGSVGLQRFTKPRVFNPATDALAQRIMAQTSFSVAPYTGIIEGPAMRKLPDGTFEELPWNTPPSFGLVPSFTLGLLNRHHKHVVLQADKQASIPDLVPSDIWINLNMYRVEPDLSDTQTQSMAEKWEQYSPETKERIHQKGVDLVEALDLENPAVQAKIFDFTRLNGDREYHALVISSHGATPVGIPAAEREFLDAKLIRAIRLEDRYRDLPPEYEDVSPEIESLKKTSPEGARILVIDTLPDPAMLATLYQEGVRGVLFKAMSKEHAEIGSVALNDTMNTLTNAGMQFIQFDQGDTWVYQHDQMVRHSKREAMNKANIRIVNYGTANDKRTGHQAEMEDFLQHVVDFFDAAGERDGIVFEDGAAGGSMRISSQAGRRARVLTSGFAIFGEIVNKLDSRKESYDAHWVSPIRDLPSRQGWMIQRRSLAIAHEGGIGTLLETLYEALSEQLLEKQPFPIFVIDKPEKIAAIRQLMHVMCKPDEAGNSLTQPWVEKLFVFCESYDIAKKEIDRIMPNLPAWLEEIATHGMSPAQFETAVRHEIDNIQLRGVSGINPYFATQLSAFAAKQGLNLQELLAA